MGDVVLRTHGGLGNQLFQILFGRLFAGFHALPLKEVHDGRYQHRFERARVPVPSPSPGRLSRLVSAARVPKVLERISKRAESPWRFLGDWYLDGYFQHADQYRIFDEANLRSEILRLASELHIGVAYEDAVLVHLRVGDFFGDREAARLHVLERLHTIPSGSKVMTNDEPLLEDLAIRDLMSKKGVRLESTVGFAPEEVLRTLARHRHLDANDSTLTVWAHILAGTQVNFRDSRLSALAAHLGAHGPGR